MKRITLLYASAVAAIVAIVFATAVTILGEYSLDFKDWLKSIFGHHWTTKSIFTMIVYIGSFALCYIYPHRSLSSRRVRGALLFLLLITVVSTIILVMFFAKHYFG